MLYSNFCGWRYAFIDVKVPDGDGDTVGPLCLRPGMHNFLFSKGACVCIKGDRLT